jgi:hypothetical protein
MPHGGFPALTRIVGKTAKAKNSCYFCLAAAFFGSPRRLAGMLVAL